MVLALTTQQTIAVVIAVVLTLGWIGYLLYAGRSTRRTVGSEIELAPNRRPYYDDDELETRKLDRSLTLGLAFLVIIGVGLPLYWLNEPFRQEGDEEAFAETFAERGAALFATTAEGGFNCAGCHGPEGVGGVAPFTLTDPETGEPTAIVQWEAPSLNDVLARFDEEEVRRIIVHGRPNTPMPAWGVEGGGPMNEQQVNNLIAYIETLQLDRDEILAEAQEFGTDGEALFENYCARCHTQGAAYGEPGTPGGGAFGPSLIDGVTVRQFPVFEDHVAFVTEGSDFEEPYGERGIGSGRMPGFGGMLTPEQIEAIVEYERSL